MYNYKNDQRNLLTREQRDHEQTWQQQMFSFSNNGKADEQKALPQAGHLQDIERALIENALNKNGTNNENSSSPSSSILLGSKGSCTEKLNILFGLANQQQSLSNQSSSNTMISLNNDQRPSSSMSFNLPNGNNNDNDMESAINKMIKPSLAPIGTKRSSSISYLDNQRKHFSGHTVISSN
ncbi:hypothetical protein BLA29_011400, partial [Euroglyphus maynei]